LKRWEELEKQTQYSLPQNYEQALEQLLGKVKENNQLATAKNQLQLQITTDRPYTEFAKAVENSSDSITIGQFAKLLKNEGIKIGRNKLFEWFRVNRYLIKRGREYNVPVQRYVEQGLFEVRENVIHTITKNILKTTTLLTGKGQMYFLQKLQTGERLAI